ncbi:non-specific serine/threonine protein kinase [Entamoeba marina]
MLLFLILFLRPIPADWSETVVNTTSILYYGTCSINDCYRNGWSLELDDDGIIFNFTESFQNEIMIIDDRSFDNSILYKRYIRFENEQPYLYLLQFVIKNPDTYVVLNSSFLNNMTQILVGCFSNETNCRTNAIGWVNPYIYSNSLTIFCDDINQKIALTYLTNPSSPYEFPYIFVSGIVSQQVGGQLPYTLSTTQINQKKNLRQSNSEDYFYGRPNSPEIAVERSHFIRISQVTECPQIHQMKTFSDDNLKNREKRIFDEQKAIYKSFLQSQSFDRIKGMDNIELSRLSYRKTLDISQHIFEVCDRENNTKYHLFIKNNSNDSNTLKNYEDIHSPFILEPNHIFQNNKYSVYVQLQPKSKSLQSYMRDHSFNSTTAKILTTQLISLVLSLHKVKLSLINTTPDSFYVTSNGFIFVNLMNLISNKTCVFPEFISPEYCVSNLYDDWWVVGVIVYYLLAKKFPFEGNSAFTTLSDVVGKSDLWESQNIEEDGKNFVTNLLRKDLEDRLNDDTICNHSWFSDVNWIDVSELKLLCKLDDFNSNS